MQIRRHMLFLIFTTTIFLFQAPAKAQVQVRTVRNPATGDVRVDYQGSSGEHYEMVIEARDKVNVMTHTEIASEGDVLLYRYRFIYLPMETPWQAVFSVDLPCPLDDPELFLRRPDNWRAWQNRNRPLELGCSFTVVAEPYLLPGSAASGFTVSSKWLPRIGEARVLGLTEGPVVISGEDTPDEVSHLIQELQGSGAEGTWFGTPAVAPTIDPSSVTDPVSGIRVFLTDLGQACNLNWISNPGVCNSLRVKLEQAGRALERGNNEAATGQLQAFLNELEAQHGDEPGKHVNDNAYWLLKVNVKFILERME